MHYIYYFIIKLIPFDFNLISILDIFQNSLKESEFQGVDMSKNVKCHPQFEIDFIQKTATSSQTAVLEVSALGHNLDDSPASSDGSFIVKMNL